MNTVKKHAVHGISQFRLTHNLLNNLSQFEITPTAKLVLLYLSACYNPKKADMFPKQKTIAAKLGVSEASVIRAISELHKEGLIISERKYTNRYKFTSKIVSEQTENEEVSEPDNLQVEINKNESLETCKMQAHEHEPIKEPNKEPQKSDDEILIKYAEQKGAKNKVAYINAIKRNGGACEIVNEMRQVEANKKAMQNITKTFLEADKESRETAEAPTQYWKDMKAELQKLCERG